MCAGMALIPSPRDKLVARLQGVVNQNYLEELSEKISDALATKVARGEMVGPPPLGYRRPRYAGRIPDKKGGLHDAKFEPLVDAQTWAACERARLRARPVRLGGVTRRPSRYLLSGILRCKRCGSTVSGEHRPLARLLRPPEFPVERPGHVPRKSAAAPRLPSPPGTVLAILLVCCHNGKRPEAEGHLLHLRGRAARSEGERGQD